MDPDMSAFSSDSLAARLLAVLPRSRVIRHRVDRGASVFRQGDPAAAVFLVETGRVRLVRVLADGLPLVLYVAEAGEGFAEASLSATHYHCDAVAETDATVLALPKADLLSALAVDPAECLALVLALAAQVRELRATLELRNPPRMPIRRSWTQVADELGLTREAVYRALAMLERQRRISRDAGAVCLTIGVEQSITS
jgi:CRP-like cAMP-binding protein